VQTIRSGLGKAFVNGPSEYPAGAQVFWLAVMASLYGRFMIAPEFKYTGGEIYQRQD
jgi:hypothetical protein